MWMKYHQIIKMGRLIVGSVMRRFVGYKINCFNFDLF